MSLAESGVMARIKSLVFPSPRVKEIEVEPEFKVRDSRENALSVSARGLISLGWKVAAFSGGG